MEEGEETALLASVEGEGLVATMGASVVGAALVGAAVVGDAVRDCSVVC